MSQCRQAGREQSSPNVHSFPLKAVFILQNVMLLTNGTSEFRPAVRLKTKPTQRHGCAGVMFLSTQKAGIKALCRWPGLVPDRCSEGPERFTAPGWHPQSHLLFICHLSPDFLQVSQGCSSGAAPLFMQGSTSNSYMTREWLGGEGGGDCLTDAQQGFVSGPLWSYWLTDTWRVANSVCVCVCLLCLCVWRLSGTEADEC